MENFIAFRLGVMVGDSSSYYVTQEGLEEPDADPILVDSMAIQIISGGARGATGRSSWVFYKDQFFQLYALKQAEFALDCASIRSAGQYSSYVIVIAEHHAGFTNGLAEMPEEII